MNGRIYDPTLGRFLQADPIIQAPTDLQSYNRYAYVRNNPLTLTDPSGYSWLSKAWKKIKPFISVIVGAALIYFTGGLASSWFAASWYGAAAAGAIAGGVGAAVNGGNILTGALKGAVSAAAFYGVGTAFSGGDFGSSAYFAKVAAHGTVGGVMGVLQGGKFGHGFAAAGVTQAFSKVISGIDKGSRFSGARIAASAVVGGTASKLSGGKFANGGVTGAFSRMFNDELHDELVKENARAMQEHIANLDPGRGSDRAKIAGWGKIFGYNNDAAIIRSEFQAGLYRDLMVDSLAVYVNSDALAAASQIANGATIPDIARGMAPNTLKGAYGTQLHNLQQIVSATMTMKNFNNVSEIFSNTLTSVDNQSVNYYGEKCGVTMKCW